MKVIYINKIIAVIVTIIPFMGKIGGYGDYLLIQTVRGVSNETR